MDRYTHKDAERALERLAASTGHRIATSYNDIGAWTLDYNPIYGGCVVHEPMNESGGVTCPFGMERQTPRVFCAMANFAIRAMEAASASALASASPARG